MSTDQTEITPTTIAFNSSKKISLNDYVNMRGYKPTVASHNADFNTPSNNNQFDQPGKCSSFTDSAVFDQDTDKSTQNYDKLIDKSIETIHPSDLATPQLKDSGTLLTLDSQNIKNENQSDNVNTIECQSLNIDHHIVTDCEMTLIDKDYECSFSNKRFCDSPTKSLQNDAKRFKVSKKKTKKAKSKTKKKKNKNKKVHKYKNKEIDSDSSTSSLSISCSSSPSISISISSDSLHEEDEFTENHIKTELTELRVIDSDVDSYQIKRESEVDCEPTFLVEQSIDIKDERQEGHIKEEEDGEIKDEEEAEDLSNDADLIGSKHDSDQAQATNFRFNRNLTPASRYSKHNQMHNFAKELHIAKTLSSESFTKKQNNTNLHAASRERINNWPSGSLTNHEMLQNVSHKRSSFNYDPSLHPLNASKHKFNNQYQNEYDYSDDVPYNSTHLGQKHSRMSLTHNQRISPHVNHNQIDRYHLINSLGNLNPIFPSPAHKQLNIGNNQASLHTGQIQRQHFNDRAPSLSNSKKINLFMPIYFKII
jgi:hypothetical protein